MITTLLTIWKFIVKYKAILIIAIILGLIFLSVNFYKQMTEYKNDYNRQSENLKNYKQELTIEKSKNGDLIYFVNSLQLTTDELKKINTGVIEEIKDMKLKLKNIQSVNTVKYSVEKIYDTIKTEKPIVFENIKGKELQYKFFNDKDSTVIKGNINIPIKNELNYGFYAINELSQPYISNLSFNFNGKLTVVNEIEYKRVWLFWRKPIGVKLHIKSNSDIFKINQMESINLIKK